MGKMMILTDSLGNPRSFPPSEVFDVEETWPYLLKAEFQDTTFWQLTIGDMLTETLLNQPMAYLTSWKPDIIIIQSGINDCTPEAFAPEKFRIKIKKFKMVFAASKIYWMGICTSSKYAQMHEGIAGRIDAYNRIIEEIYQQQFIPLQERIEQVGGFNAADHIHWNKLAHKAAAEILIGRLHGS